MFKGMKKSKKILLTVLFSILAIILALLIAFLAFYINGKIQFHKGDKNIEASNVKGLDIDDESVTYKGKNYVLDKDVVSVLFMGVDKKDIADNFGFGANGQADSIIVAAINTRTKKIKLIPIQRESMIDVNTYTKDGEYIGTNREQICLAYAYGDDEVKSCENVKTSASRYLMGINIGSYVALDLTGVEKLADAVGGVNLTAIENVRNYDGSTLCSVGDNITLKGRNATAYIQLRELTAEGSSKRLERQKQFLTAFTSVAGNQILNDFTKLKTYYDITMPYVCTDLTFSKVSYLATSCLSKNIGGMMEYKTIKGKSEVNEKTGYLEFRPNKQSLTKAILDSFYKKKPKK